MRERLGAESEAGPEQVFLDERFGRQVRVLGGQTIQLALLSFGYFFHALLLTGSRSYNNWVGRGPFQD